MALDPMIKALAIVAAWLNTRGDLALSYGFDVDDFQIASFVTIGEDWKAMVVSTGMAGMHYKVTYDSMAKQTLVEQYHRVERTTFRDEDLEDGHRADELLRIHAGDGSLIRTDPTLFEQEKGDDGTE